MNAAVAYSRLAVSDLLASAGPIWRDPLSRLMDGSYAGVLLLVLYVYSMIRFGFRLIREFPLRCNYFSSLFVLALCPYLTLSGIGLIKLIWVAHHARGIDNLAEQVSPLVAYFILGILSSIAAITLYSTVYAASRKQSANVAAVLHPAQP